MTARYSAVLRGQEMANTSQPRSVFSKNRWEELGRRCRDASMIRASHVPVTSPGENEQLKGLTRLFSHSFNHEMLTAANTQPVRAEPCLSCSLMAPPGSQTTAGTHRECSKCVPMESTSRNEGILLGWAFGTVGKLSLGEPAFRSWLPGQLHLPAIVCLGG